MVKHWFVVFLLLISFHSASYADILYTEDFTGDGDVGIAGWTGVYDDGGSNGGLAGDFAWVWHNGDCKNVIYTHEFTLDPASCTDIVFSFGLRKHDVYDQTPESSLIVQVAGNWYVSKTVFVSSSDNFETQTLDYNPAADNWDTFDMASVSRGTTAVSDLAGQITGIGFYSDSQNEGSCTAEYDDVTVAATLIRVADPSPDFNDNGVVDLADFEAFASAWQSVQGQTAFNADYDLHVDHEINLEDLYSFVQDWLSGISYPYVPVESSRLKESFNVGWKFYRGAISGDAAGGSSYDDSGWEGVNIPHNPKMNPPDPDPLRPGWPDYSYEGVSWYRKHFYLDAERQGKKIFIEFEGANTVSDVWVNGTHLTTHYGGYLPFTVDVTEFVNFDQTENVLAVKVDNTDNADVPIGNAGWFNWGGIYRDVWLHVTDPLHVTDAVYADRVAGGGVFVTYPSLTASEAQVQVKTHIQNEHPTAVECTVKSYIVDAENMVVSEMIDSQTIAAGADYTFTQQGGVTDPALWHPHHPNLYTLYTEVYNQQTLADTYQTQMGIRRISFSKAEGFKINGEVFKFRGANRLQDYPYIGYAAGNMMQRRDAEKLKSAGFDYIRTSHYPQDPAFMDACDELGILVLDEIPGFQYVGGSTFKSHSYQEMRDMIRRDRNHPCVIGWELSLNETNFDSTYAQTAVAIGHAEYPGDQCYVAGWKFDTTYDIFIATPTAGATSYSGPTPLIVSEYGHWEFGGDAGDSDVHRADDIGDRYDGGEEAMLLQVANHMEGHHVNRGLSNMCGDGLWVGIDYGPYPSGVLDSFRIPKFSHYFWQSQQSADVLINGIDCGPMVYIANHWTALSPTDVTVYSNCDQVKLYINDVLQDTRTPDADSAYANLQHRPFTFEGLVYQAGQLKAEALIGGQVVASHAVQTPATANSLQVVFDATDVEANGSETIFVYGRIVDANGTVVPDASNNVTFTVTGPASLQSPSTVRAEAGIATAIIRVSDQPGLITATAAASGLASANASLTTH